jgi:hypothetical protein
MECGGLALFTTSGLFFRAAETNNGNSEATYEEPQGNAQCKQAASVLLQGLQIRYVLWLLQGRVHDYTAQLKSSSNPLTATAELADDTCYCCTHEMWGMHRR